MRTVLVALAVLVAACSSSSDSGSSSSPSTGGATVGEQCKEIMSDLCGKVIDECMAKGAGLETTSAQCESDGTPPCCGGSCDVTSLSTDAAIQQCRQDLNAATCAQLWDGSALHLPSSCVGAVKHPASLPLHAPASGFAASLAAEE